VLLNPPIEAVKNVNLIESVALEENAASQHALHTAISHTGRDQEPPKTTSVVRPTLLYINSEAVIPAKAGIQLRNTGFRVKPGMTIKVKGLLTQYTSR
jgi:hypothetical protein